MHLFDAAQKERLYSNIAASMGGVPAHIMARAVAEFRKVEPAYGDGVARAAGNIDNPPNSDPQNAGRELTAVEFQALLLEVRLR